MGGYQTPYSLSRFYPNVKSVQQIKSLYEGNFVYKDILNWVKTNNVQLNSVPAPRLAAMIKQVEAVLDNLNCDSLLIGESNGC